jgi:putative transposase
MIGISPSTYYYRPKQDRLERAKEDSDIKVAIEELREDFPRSGYRTLQYYLLREHAIKVGETRLRRIIRENELQAKQVKKFVKTTWSDHDELVYPNLLPEMTVTDINQVWVVDITYSTPSRSGVAGCRKSA